MKSKMLSSALHAVLFVSCCFLSYRAEAIYDIYPCCVSIWGGCEFTTCQAQWDECECLGQWAGNCGVGNNCTPFGGPTIAYNYAFANQFYVLDASSSTIHKYTLPTTGLTMSTNISGVYSSVDFAVGAWANGTNLLTTTAATNVSFYSVPASVFAEFANSNILQNLPWTFIGNGTNNSTTGLWNINWTPPSYQAYVVNADIYDPSLTNSYTNNVGVVMTGITSALASVVPAPSSLQIAYPVSTPNGNFTFKAVGPAANQFSVQASPDLKAWQTVLTITNFNGLVNFANSTLDTNHLYFRATSSN
jgi:hypothetical protein